MLFRSPRFIITTIACFVALFAIANVRGQDANTLDDLQKQWAEINKKLDEKQSLLESGDTTPGLSQEFGILVEEANDLVNQLRVSAIAKLDAEPDSTETIRLLMGIMINDSKVEKDGEVLQAGDALIRAKVSPKYFEYGATNDKLDLTAKRIFEELMIRHREAMDNDLPQVELETSKGKIVIELFENEAPNSVANFISLVESGYYSNKLFHKVVEGVFAQSGGFEKAGIGSGNPGYMIQCETDTPDARPHFTGSLSMAIADGQSDTGGGQFFLTYKRTDDFDGISTVFGRIISGIEVLKKLEFTSMMINGSPQEIPEVNYDKIISAKVIRKREHEYKPKKVGDPEPKATPPATPDLGKKEDDPEMKKEESGTDDEEDESVDDDKKSGDGKEEVSDEKAAPDESAESDQSADKKNDTAEDQSAEDKTADDDKDGSLR